MKHLIFSLSLLSATISYAQQGAGTMDQTFDSDGRVLIEQNLGTIPPMGEGNEFGTAIYSYSGSGDASMLVGGHAYHTNEDTTDMFVTKILHNGNIDTSFGFSGTEIIAFNRGTETHKDFLHDILVDDSGNIYAIGYAHFNNDDTDFAVAKLDSSGNPVLSFGTNGQKTIAFDNGGTDEDVAFSAIYTGGSIYIAGYAANSSGGTDISVTKILASDGSLDTGFGTNGKLIIDMGNSSRAYKILHGFWILGSIDESDNSESPVIIKMNFNGSLDTSFSSDGKYVYNDSRDSFVNNAIKKPGSDEFIFVGYDNHMGSQDDDCAITYINTEDTNAGEPVGDIFNFNLNPNLSKNSSCRDAVFTDPDFKLVLTGNIYPDDVSYINMGVMQLNSISVTNGTSSYSIDNNFGVYGNGRSDITFNGVGAQIVNSAYAVTIDPNDNVLLTGTATNNNAVEKIAVARLKGTGNNDIIFKNSFD